MIHGDARAAGRGILLVVAGPSGVGKGTLIRGLRERHSHVRFSVSCTTRGPRPGEGHGEDYHFVSTEAFERQLEQGGLLEYARVYGGRYYGTPAPPVVDALAAGRVVILEIEIDGTIQVVRRFPDAIAIYILAPTPAEQADRLAGREKDSAEAIKERLSKADGEIRYAYDSGVYRHLLVNETIAQTVDDIVRIVREAQSV